MAPTRTDDWHEVATSQGGCPISHTLDVIEGKWTLQVVRQLLDGTKRFTEIKRGMGGINPRTLAERLRSLEDAGMVVRTAYAEVPPRVEYTLTERGRSLDTVLEAMAWWGVADSAAQAPRQGAGTPAP
jgi:DNA-binding HxlR family transcriptional regulator